LNAPPVFDHCCDETVATDTLWSDTSAIFGGQIDVQAFVGTTLFVTDVEGVKNDKVC
jgi:hypothetical protein